MSWDAEKHELLAAGFSDQEIAEEQGKQREEMLSNGFALNEVNSYFGVSDPDVSKTKSLIEENLKNAPAKEMKPLEAGAIPEQPPSEADNLLDAIEAGFQISTAGLVARGKMPDKVLPEHAGMAMRLASQAATLVGDIPAMAVGRLVGTPVGAAAGSLVVPGAGSAIGGLLGAGAGTFALPTAIRETLVDHYKNGDYKSFGDFWERAAPILLDTAKSGAVGAATFGVGAVAGKAAGSAGASAALQTSAKVGSEIVTMTTVGAALDGRVPKAQEFADAALLILGAHGVGIGTGKLMDIYAKTGVHPKDVAEQAIKDPAMQAEIASTDGSLPSAFDNGKKVEIPNMAEGENSPLSPEFSPPKQLPETLPEPIKPEPKPKTSEPTESMKKITDQFGVKETTKFEFPTFRDFYSNFVDKTNPIKGALQDIKAGKKDVLNDPQMLARLSVDANAKMVHFLEKAPLDFKTLGETGGKGLTQILSPVGDRIQEFAGYLTSKKVINMESRGMKSGFDVEAAKTAIKEYKKDFEPIAKEFYSWRDSILQYAIDSQVLSPEAGKSMRDATSEYITFSRIMEGETGGKGKGKNAFKTLKGVEEPTKIENPIIALIENSREIIRQAEINRAVLKFTEVMNEAGENSLIKKVDTRIPIQIKSSEITDALAKQGIDVADIEGFTVFRNDKVQLGPDQFSVKENGRTVVYETEPAIAEAIKQISGNGPMMSLIPRMLLKIASAPSAMLRIGTTFTPEFQIKNTFRDQIAASINAKYKAIPFWDAVSVVPSLLKKDQLYWDWMKSGGADGAFFDINENYIQRDIFKLSKQTGLVDKAYNVVRSPVDMLQLVATLSERSSRLGAFKRQTNGARDAQSLMEGGIASRESTVDFQRMGLKMSALNSISAFMNVGVQGVDRTVRAIKDDPKGIALKGAALITLPSVALWLANKDDERYKAIPRWQKDVFWIFPTDDWQEAKSSNDLLVPDYLKRVENGKTYVNKGAIYRLPKPQELGIIFGTLPERLLEKFVADNPLAGKEFAETILSSLSPNVIPDILKPGVETYFNKSLFTGNKVIPGFFEDNPINPEYQYTNYTSETAKALGKMVAKVPGFKQSQVANPILIDHWVQAWTGSLGKYALGIADKGLITTGAVPDPIKPASTLSDIPFIKAFVVRHPSNGTQHIQDFYELYARNKQTMSTIKYLGKTGKFDALQAEIIDEENRAQMFQLEGMKSALSAQNAMIQKIYSNPKMTPNDKRQLIDGIYYQMSETAKLGVKKAMEFEKTVREQSAQRLQ